MIRATTYAIERFGIGCTMKLLLMVAVVAGCLGAAILTGPAPKPTPTTLDMCSTETTLHVATGTTSREVTC